MLLGAGTSLTQEAAIFCAFNDLQVAFVRGGTNVHSFFMSGRYQNPESIMNQAQLMLTDKFKVAQLLMEYRLHRDGLPQPVIDDMLRMPDLPGLLAWEGRHAIAVYRLFALRSKTPFSRDFAGADEVNIKLNILNNSLYSICTAVCLSCGLHPSMGFIHGYTRRGGFAFDLADIFKNQLTLPLAFDKKIKSGKFAMYELSKKLKQDNAIIVKTMIKLCLLIATRDISGLEEFCRAGRSCS